MATEPPSDLDGHAARRARRLRRAAVVALLALACVAIGAAWRSYRRREVAEQRLVEATDERAHLETRRRASDLALRAWAARESDAKIRLLREAIEIDPTWDEAYLRLSVAVVERARELDPTSPDDARALRAKAIEAATAAIALGVGARGELQRAAIYEALEDHASAHDAYSEAARTATDGEWSIRYAALAAIAFREHRWADVIADTTKAIAEEPRVDVVWYRRAVAHRMQRDMGDALADADHAIALGASEARYWTLRAEVHFARGERREAAVDLVAAARGNARDARVLDALARWALRAGELERARRLSEEAVSVGRHVPDAFVGRARVRLARGERESAGADVDEALRLDPLCEDALAMRRALADAFAQAPESTSPSQLVALAGEAWDRGDLELASSRSERALLLEPRDADALFFRARLLVALRRDAEAIAAIDKATRAAGAARFHVLRAQTRRRLALPDEGDAEKAVALGDTSPAALRERGIARAAEKKYALAVIDLESALRGDALDVDARLALLALGRAIPEAREAPAARASALALLVAVAPDLEGDVKKLDDATAAP